MAVCQPARFENLLRASRRFIVNAPCSHLFDWRHESGSGCVAPSLLTPSILAPGSRHTILIADAQIPAHIQRRALGLIGIQYRR